MAKERQNEQHDLKGKIKGNKVGNIFTIRTLRMLRIFGTGIIVLGVLHYSSIKQQLKS